VSLSKRPYCVCVLLCFIEPVVGAWGLLITGLLTWGFRPIHALSRVSGQATWQARLCSISVKTDTRNVTDLVAKAESCEYLLKSFLHESITSSGTKIGRRLCRKAELSALSASWLSTKTTWPCRNKLSVPCRSAVTLTYTTTRLQVTYSALYHWQRHGGLTHMIR
jgi:hypothetical protein